MTPSYYTLRERDGTSVPLRSGGPDELGLAIAARYGEDVEVVALDEPAFGGRRRAYVIYASDAEELTDLYAAIAIVVIRD